MHHNMEEDKLQKTEEQPVKETKDYEVEIPPELADAIENLNPEQQAVIIQKVQTAAQNKPSNRLD